MRLLPKATLPAIHPYLHNKYTTWYYSIIESARQRETLGYCETHHIIPRCMDGSNCQTNLVRLTAREHFVCHLLLTNMVNNKLVLSKLTYAAWQMSCRAPEHGVKVSGRIYESLRQSLSQTYKGNKRKPFSEQWRKNMSISKQGEKNNMFGKSHRLDSREKMSISLKGKRIGEENPFFGKKHSESVKDKIRQVNSRIYTCPHCHKSGASNSMRRWHFDRCKHYSSDQR